MTPYICWRPMKTLRLHRFALLLVAGACVPASDQESDFVLVSDVQQLMVNVVEPAAEVYWDAVGTIVDAEGVHEMYPTTEEEWMAVVSAAVTLTESGNLLMMEGRALDQGAWITMSQAMISMGERAIEAAAARNLEAMFDTGAEVYYTCTNCHATYAIETLRPTDDRVN